MGKWEKVKIGSFLRERIERFKPDKANKLGLKRIDKIDFSGKIHLSEGKTTKTNMVLVKPGDLVISGINVEKGAIAVYHGEGDVLATIHYSSYEVDINKIDIDYFKWFLKSKVFKEIVNSKIREGIKTELKPKKFLPLEIPLPDKKTQIEIRNKISEISNEIKEFKKIQILNKNYIQKLNQSILQEAVQGKLVLQNPNDEPASELLRKIKAEKEKLIRERKIRKEKSFAQISDDEVPYNIPDSWIWCRLGDIGTINPSNNCKDELEVSFIPMNLISSAYGITPKYWVKKWREVKKGFTHFAEKDVVVAKITPCFENSKACIMKNLRNKIGAGTTELHVFRGNTNLILPEYVYIYFKSPKFLEIGKSKMTGTAGQQRVPKDFIIKNPFPLPPFTEQRRIVEKVDKFMIYCDELQEEINKNNNNSEELMESVLKKVFLKETSIKSVLIY